MGQWLRHIVRLVVSALVLMFVSFLVPGFMTASFTTAVVAAIVITLLGWLVEAVMGRTVSPYARGIVGFLVSALVIYVASLIVTGFSVTVGGALIAALVIGIVDMFVPTTLPVKLQVKQQVPLAPLSARAGRGFSIVGRTRMGDVKQYSRYIWG